MSFSLEVMPKLLCFSSTYLSNWKDACQEFYTRKHTYEYKDMIAQPRIIILSCIEHCIIHRAIKAS